MKKILVLILALALVLSLAACGGNNGTTTTTTTETTQQSGTQTEATGTAPAAPASESYDVGEFTLDVPNGWMIVPQTDIWAEGDDKPVREDAILLVKGGTNEYDAFSKPCLYVYSYEPDSFWGDFESSLDWYDEVEILDQITLGGTTYDCATGLSMDVPYYFMLNTDKTIQINFITEASNGDKISIDDADVQAIIGSIKLK